MVGPQRRSSSVTSSCVSLEFGDLQDGQSPGRTNGLGKSPVASMTSSPHTPAGLEKSGSPSAMKKRRASIGGADDLARGLDFGTTSPSTEEKKHPFLTRGGGHKKVVSPATQVSSPGKKVTTPPGKEKLVAVRATAVSTLSPRKSVEAKKDITSPRRSVLGSEGASMNGSEISEGTSSLVEVTSKKASPRASLESKVSAGKPSPRSNTKLVASTKGRKNSNGDSTAIDSSPPEKFSSAKTPDLKISSVKSPDVKISSVKSPDVKISSVKSPDVKLSSVKTPDVKTKKSSPQSPVPSLKLKPGLTSPKSQKSAKTRQHTPSQPGRAKTRIEKAVRTENLQKPELDSVAVPLSPENEIQAKSENVVVDKMEDGSTLLPSLMVDDNVGDEDMSSLDQGGDPGFDNDLEMPTSWLSEDLPCMFSSLSRLPEPDDSSSSHFGDPPEFLDEPFAEDTKQKSSELANSNDLVVAAELMPRSPVASQDEEFVATGIPSETSEEVGGSEWIYQSRTFALLEDPIEAEFGHDQPCESNELESQQPSPFPEVVKPVTVSQGERMPCMVTTCPEELSSSNNGSTVPESVAPEAFLSVNENPMTEERNLQFLSESRSMSPVYSQSDEDPAELVTQVAVPKRLESNGGVYHFDSSREMDATSALPEEERWTAGEDEVSATQDHLVMQSSDDESSEDFIEGTCGAQLNLKQSFDDAAEPAASHNEVEGTRDVLPRDSRQDTSDMDLESMTTVDLSTNGEILPEVIKVIESEFADESQEGQESGTFTQTHVDKDMMIFDFEEYWTQNAGDESFHSDAGQNDAEDLQPYSMRETQLPSPVLEDEAEKPVPLNELPVSNLPGDEFINLKPESSDQFGVTRLDSRGWPCINSSAPIPDSNASEMDAKRADQELDEVFHLFEGSDHLSPKAGVLVENLSYPEKPTVEINQEPLAPIFSQFKIASEPDTSASPRYTPIETEHSNGVDIGQGNQNLDVPEDKDVELEVAEHQKYSVHTIVAQESPVADLHSPKTDMGLSNDKARGDQESLAQEGVDTPPIPSVKSNGLLGTNIHLLDDNNHASDESVDLDGPEDPEFSPVTIQVSSQKSSFETPALADAYLSDDSSEMGPENLSVPQVLEVRAISVQTAETTDDRDATETNELLPDASHSSHNRDIASPIAGTDDSHDLVSPVVVDSFKLMTVERDQNILISSAGVEEDPLGSRTPVISLPPMNDTSEEEHTEAIFLSRLGSKEDSNHNEDSSTDHELQVNQSQEKLQGRGEIIKDLDSDFRVGGDIISEPIEKFQDMSSESREGEIEVPEHDNTQILPRVIFPVEERPQEIQSQDDERIEAPVLQVESYGGTVDVLEVDHQSQMPLISTPETLQDDKETPDLVPTQHALPTGGHDESHALVSVPCSPVFDQADDKFDSKSEVESTASLHESDEETDPLIAASGSTVTDTTSPSEILGKGEAIHSTPEATPPTLSAGKLSNLTLNETDEFDDKLGSEVTIDEEGWRIVSDFGEQSSTAEHGWEEPLLTTDSSGSKSSTKNLFRQESMVTHAGNSGVADDANDLETDMDVSEEAFSTISTPVSTPNGTKEYHDPDFQETHLPLGKSISTDGQVSRSEDALETEKVMVASSDASVDDSDDHAIKDVEIVPEHFSSKDLPFERFVASNQQIFNAAMSDVGEVDSEPTQFKEEENLSETLEPIPLLKDESMVVESPKTSFIHSSQDTAEIVDVEEIERTSAPQLTLQPKMNTADTFAPENVLRSSPEQHSTEETVLEDEETVVYSPKNSFVASGTSDTKNLANIDGGTHSLVSWTASKEEESFNGNLEGESSLNDELVDCPKDRIDFAVQDQNTTNSGSHGIHAVSWKDENETSSLVEKPLHEEEDTAVASPKKFSVISGEDTAISDVDASEEKSWKGGNEEEESLNGSLERGEETMVGEVVSSPMSQFNIPAEETPQISTSDVHYIQNHSHSLWSGESFDGSLKGEPLLEDEDTVVYRPVVGEFIMEESSPKSVENVVDSHMEILNAPEDAVANGHTPESLMEGSTYVGKVVDSPMETSNATKDTVVCRPSVGDSTPELMEKSSIEGVETVVDRHMEVFNVPEHDATNAAISIVEEQEAQRDDKERESLNGSHELESKFEVEKNSEESFVAPDLLEANYTSNVVEAEESEKQTDEEQTLDQRLVGNSSSEVEQPVVERLKESFVSRDRQNATNTSNVAVAELEKQIDKDEETLDRSLDSYSPLEVEETGVESSEKELFFAPDLVKAKDTSNLTPTEKLDEHSDKEVETVDQFLDTNSTFEVEEPVVESSGKESFVAPDLVDAKSTSHLLTAEELEKQTDNHETSDRSLEAKSMNEAEETMVESSEKESYVAPGLLDGNYTSDFVVTDQLEKQTDKEEETLDQSPEVKSTVEVEQTMKDSTIQKFVAPSLLNAKSPSTVVADELEKQTDKEAENLEEKSTLEVADMVVERSKESLVVSDSAAETFDAEDLDKHPTQKTPGKEGESLNAINLEEESILDTVVDSSSDNVKRELEYLSEEDDATKSSSGPTNLGANLAASNLNLTDEGAKEPHSSPIADDVNADSVNNSFDVSEVVQKDAVAKDSEEFSKAPAAEEESRMINGENFSKVPAAEEKESRMTNGENFSKVPAAEEESRMINGENFSKVPAAEEEESRMTNGETFSKVPAAEEESRMTNGESFSKVPAAEEESRMTNGEKFSRVPAAEEESRMTNGDKFSKVPAAEEESCMTNGEKLEDSNAPVHETADTDGITVPTTPQADTTPESTEPESPEATLYPLSKPPFSGSLQDRLWEEQAEAYNSGQGTPSRNGDHATQAGATGVSSSPKENPTSSEDQIQPVAAASNGNHAVVVGTSNGSGSHENGSTPVQDQPKGSGKEKLHTPLRSLLLEESSHAGSLTPNGVNSSPSFIRRLFRVMSTSRSVEKDASQGKLKRSSSMWVSCLGSPQVQQ